MKLQLSLIGLAVVAGLCLVATLVATWRSEQLGLKKAEALLRGDRKVQLEAIEIDYQQRGVRCSDLEALRYLEDRMRKNNPSRSDLGTTYRLRLRFAGGGSLTTTTYWFDGGFSVCMPGDTPLSDGGRPRCVVVFTPELPASVKEIVNFLDRPWQKVKGTVLILEPGAVRQEHDRSLVAE
jgi:hypothetical protein